MVSVIACCRNEAQSIRRFLASLDAQECRGFVFDITIADGGSTDGTRNALEEFAQTRSHVRVIDNPKRIASAGLNAAIRASKGAIVARMDAHSEYAPDYLLSCLSELERYGAAMVGGPVRSGVGTYWQNATGLAHRARFFSGGSRVYDLQFEGEVASVPYGCWPRRVLETVGLFDENMGRNQDDELSLRIQQRGGLIWQSPSIRSWYFPRATPRGLARQFFGYGFWKVYTMRKHRQIVHPRHIVPSAAVVLGSALAVTSPVNRLARWLLTAGCVVYAGAVAAASAAVVRNRRDVRLVPGLFAVFPVAHLAYGAGMLLGFVRIRLRP